MIVLSDELEFCYHWMNFTECEIDRWFLRKTDLSDVQPFTMNTETIEFYKEYGV